MKKILAVFLTLALLPMCLYAGDDEFTAEELKLIDTTDRLATLLEDDIVYVLSKLNKVVSLKGKNIVVPRSMSGRAFGIVTSFTGCAKHYWGIANEEKHVVLAKKRYPYANFILGSTDEPGGKMDEVVANADVILMPLTMTFTKKPEAFLTYLAQHMKTGAWIVSVDAHSDMSREDKTQIKHPTMDQRIFTIRDELLGGMKCDKQISARLPELFKASGFSDPLQFRADCFENGVKAKSRMTRLVADLCHKAFEFNKDKAEAEQVSVKTEEDMNVMINSMDVYVPDDLYYVGDLVSFMVKKS